MSRTKQNPGPRVRDQFLESPRDWPDALRGNARRPKILEGDVSRSAPERRDRSRFNEITWDPIVMICHTLPAAYHIVKAYLRCYALGPRHPAPPNEDSEWFLSHKVLHFRGSGEMRMAQSILCRTNRSVLALECLSILQTINSF